jgi:hypothetical protein
MYGEVGWEGGDTILAEVSISDRIPIFRLTTMKSPISSLIFSSSSSSSSSSLLSSAPLFLLLFFLSPSSWATKIFHRIFATTVIYNICGTLIYNI